MRRCPSLALVPALLLVWIAGSAAAGVLNLKVVTDASPDYSDMESLVRSVTSRWETPAEKCWAMFYWNHKARRQTTPMELHGLELTDPIRQLNDYGYTMCSTISGINCAIWSWMGLPARYWDISNHTVSECFYGGRWHVYDNSLSALYTLCDGKTLAGVEDVGKEGACAASGGRREPGHIAKYHCLTATSPKGFLSGADCARDLDQEFRCFNPNGLKYRSYFYDWDWGHRYILNLRPGDVYTRHARSLGSHPRYYVPNHDADPEAPNPRYRLRGNGVWSFSADLSPAGYRKAAYSLAGVAPAKAGGLRPLKAGAPGEVLYKIQGGNVITSLKLKADFALGSARDRAEVAVSATNGQRWLPVWKSSAAGKRTAAVELVEPVNGAYEVLVRVRLLSPSNPAGARLTHFSTETVTQVNSKTLPRLNVGRNTVYVGAGEQTDSIVFWPELQGGRYKELVVEERNIVSTPRHPGYQGTLHPSRAGQDAYVVYRIDAPRDITRLHYGGRFYNRAAKSRIELLHSLDGKRWTRSWSLTDTRQPWDVIHYETARIPRGHRRVWVKYLMNTPDPSPGGCSLYALRIEASHLPADLTPRPVEVTFCWSERGKDRSLTERRHTQLVTRLPFTYTVNVGGSDHPVLNWVRVSARGAGGSARGGYSDGRDVGGSRHVGKWVTYGRNLAVGKPYTLSAPSETSWDAGDPDGRKLTDGVVGPPYAGGVSYRYGALWSANTHPVITLDLGAPVSCASFGMDFHGYEWWDALKGEVTDRVEVLTSLDGRAYTSRGFLNTDLRWKDLPVNYFWPDEETLTGATFRLIPPKPVQARYVRYRVTSQRILCCTELEVLDSIRYDPFDLRIALPKDAPAARPGRPLRASASGQVRLAAGRGRP